MWLALQSSSTAPSPNVRSLLASTWSSSQFRSCLLSSKPWTTASPILNIPCKTSENTTTCKMKWNRLSRNSILLQKSKGSTDSSDVHGVWSCSGESWSVLCLSWHDLSWEWESDLAVVELLNVGSSAVLGSDRFDLNNHDYHMLDHHVTGIINLLTRRIWMDPGRALCLAPISL